MKNLKGILFVILSAVGFGLMGCLSKLASYSGVNIFTLLSFRFLIAFFVLFCICLLTKKRISFNHKLLAKLSLLGIFGYAAMAFLLFTSYKYVSISIATITFYSYPMLTYFLTVLFKQEKYKSTKVMIFTICLFGLVLSIYTGGQLNIKGIFFSFSAGLIYSIFIVTSNSFTKGVTPIFSSTIICLTAGLTLFIIGLSNQKVSIHFPLEGWMFILALAILSTVIPIVFFFNGLRIIGTSNSAILSTIEPITSIVVSLLIFQDVLKPLQIMGIVIVLSASMLSQMKFSKRLSSEAVSLRQ
jgi:drug/metabolite transporter (DMT)-like permease